MKPAVLKYASPPIRLIGYTETKRIDPHNAFPHYGGLDLELIVIKEIEIFWIIMKKQIHGASYGNGQLNDRINSNTNSYTGQVVLFFKFALNYHS